ncbi:hypothetical protein UT4_08710 [Ferrigenium sp. UT4]
MKLLPMVIACLLAASAQAGELYRSIDAQGKVHYSDRPLPGTNEVEQLHLGQQPAPDESLPYETRRAMQYFPVTLYVSEGCGSPCQVAREFLLQRGIPFSEKQVNTAEEVEALRQASGSNRVPAATVGKAWLSGFLAADWNKELDLAGYPKTAPYRPRTSP